MQPADIAIVQAFRDWQALGILPGGARSLDECPEWLVDAFRVCQAYADQAKLQEQMELIRLSLGARQT